MIGWLALGAIALLAAAGTNAAPMPGPERTLPESWKLERERRRRQEEAERKRRRERRRLLASRRAAIQANAEAALEAERRRAIEQREQRLNLVRDALVWVEHLAAQVETYVAAHWSEILQDREGVMRRYHDQTSPIATTDRCLETASWFLAEFPGEACFLLPDGERNPESVARKLRTYHGREVEMMLARAMAIGCQRALEAQARAVALPTDEQLLLEGLPEDAVKLFGEAQTVTRVDELVHEFKTRARARLFDQGMREEVVDSKLESYGRRLEEVAKKFKRSRGFIT